MQTLEMAFSIADCLGQPALSPEERLCLISHRLWLQSPILPAVAPFDIIIIKFLHFFPLLCGLEIRHLN